MAILFFGLLALVLVFPLLGPGYLLTFDMLAVPGKVIPVDFWQNGFVFYRIWSWGSMIVPVFWLQKLELFLIFFLAGWGMFWLIKINNFFVKLFAGLFYVINPFVYERVLAGHWNFLLGYSVLPFVIKALDDLLFNPSWQRALKTAVLTTLMISFSIHHAVIFLLILAVYLLIYFLTTTKISLKFFYFLGLSLFLVAIFNFNWLPPFLQGKSRLNRILAEFNSQDLVIFKSQADPDLGLSFNLLSGYGLWTEAHHYFILPKEIIPGWPLISLSFLSLSILGISVFWIRQPPQRVIGVVLALTAVIALDLASGSISWFYDNFTFVRGFREPEKLVSLAILAYSFLGAYGLEFLIKRKKIFFLLLILPLIYTPTVFGSFWGQLRPVLYPNSWQKIQKLTATNIIEYRTVFFPWHQYMRFRFNNNRPVVNPASVFLGPSLLLSWDYENEALQNHDDRLEAKHVAGLLRIQNKGLTLLGDRVDTKPDWAESLGAIGIKYIILAKEEDWQDYKFLDNAPNLKKIFEDENFILYENLLVN